MKSLLFLIAFITMSCSPDSRPAENTVFQIPAGYIGPVVLVYDQKDGVVPEIVGNDLLIKIPVGGLARVDGEMRAKQGFPRFGYLNVDGSFTDIELLVSFDPRGKYRNSNQISEEERASKIFVNSYTQGEFKTADGLVYFRAFFVGKDVDGNLQYTKMQQRITDVQRTFPR